MNLGLNLVLFAMANPKIIGKEKMIAYRRLSDLLYFKWPSFGVVGAVLKLLKFR